MSDVAVSVGLDLDQVKRDAGTLTGIFNNISGVIKTSLGVAGGLLISNVVSNVVDLGRSALQAGFDFNKMKESAMVSFTTMLGSADKAKTLMGDLNDLAKDTPYEFGEIAKASTSLLAANVGPEAIRDTLTRIGDIASGLNIPFGELSDIYSKIKTQGRLFGEDINQLQGRGIPIIQELAKQFGVSEGAVRDLVEKGKIGFPQIEKAFVSLTSKGGKFAGMMKAQSKTFEGLFSTVKDTFAQTSAEIMEPFFDLVKEGLEFITDFTDTDEFSQWVKDAAAGVRNFVSSGLIPFLKQVGFYVSYAIDLFKNLQYFFKTGDISDVLTDLQALVSGKGISKDTSPIVTIIAGILEWVRKLSTALQSGDWGKVWDVIVTGLQNAWTSTIEPTLKDWGTKFWTWLNDPKDGAIAKAGGELNKARDGIVDWIQKNGPAKWDELVKWASDFWKWLNGPDGAIQQAGTQVQTFATRVGTALSDEWTNTVKPALAKWGTDFWEWLSGKGGAIDQASAEIVKMSNAFVAATQTPEAKAANQNAGYYMGVDIMNGIISVFSGKGGGEGNWADSLNKALSANAAASRAWFKAGGDYLDAMVAGMKQTFNDKVMPFIQAYIATIAAIIKRTLATAVADGLIEGMKLFNLPLPAPSLLMGPSLPSLPSLPGGSGAPFASMTSGATPTFNLNVKIGDKEIKDALLTVTYNDVTNLFSEAQGMAMTA